MQNNGKKKKKQLLATSVQEVREALFEMSKGDLQNVYSHGQGITFFILQYQ